VAVQHFPRYINLQQRQHSVDVVLLSVIIRGRGRHYMGKEVHEEIGGSISVTHYGQMHDIVTDSQGMEIYNIYLDLVTHPLPILPEELRSTLSAILPVHPSLQHHLNRRVWIGIDKPEIFVASLKRIEKEMDNATPGAIDIVRHSFQVFLIDLCRVAERHGFTLSQSSDCVFPIWAEKIRRELDRDFAIPQDLHKLAKGAGVSVAYLCRIFKAYTGKTVVEYLVDRRIQASIWRLRERGEKIITIALSCGFNDLAYFNRTFKRIIGMTPSEYRNSKAVI